MSATAAGPERLEGGAGAALLGALASPETDLVHALRGDAQRPPIQRNGAYETDAELIELGGSLIALNIDTLHADSELLMAAGPYERGRLAAAATLSDLAAVAAAPRALMLSCSLAVGTSAEDAAELGRGARETAAEQGAHMVGGDTNWAAEESLTGFALGVVEGRGPLTRLGARAGDALYITGPVGAGNAAGVRALLGQTDVESWYPVPRCSAGIELAGRARACIDTSDGLLSGAAMLAELNELGVELWDGDELYEPAALQLANRLGVPSWLLAAGEWGEYELLFALPPEHERECVAALGMMGIGARAAGRFTEGRELSIATRDGRRIDARRILGRLADPGAAQLERLVDLVREVS